MGISIITVSLNAERVIEETIRSVLTQTFQDFEYILVDGGSADGTLEIIQKYARKDSRLRYISERDDGLYDAMNKGIGLAEGEYIHFLNAGDVYKDSRVLERVEKLIRSVKRSDIYYGDILYSYPDGTEKLRRYPASCGSALYYVTGDCINHQAVFAGKECFRNDHFDLRYRYCADRDWMMRMHKAGKKYRAMKLTVCRYSLDPESMSVKHEKEAWEEAEDCMKRHYPGLFPLYRLVNRIRHGKISVKLLHGVYQLLYVRGSEK